MSNTNFEVMSRFSWQKWRSSCTEIFFLFLVAMLSVCFNSPALSCGLSTSFLPQPPTPTLEQLKVKNLAVKGNCFVLH